MLKHTNKKDCMLPDNIVNDNAENNMLNQDKENILRVMEEESQAEPSEVEKSSKIHFVRFTDDTDLTIAHHESSGKSRRRTDF